MLRRLINVILLLQFLSLPFSIVAQNGSNISYLVTMEHPANKTFHVQMNCVGFRNESMIFKMPVWTPGYYQRMNYAKNVRGFHAADSKGRELTVETLDSNTWKVSGNSTGQITLTYDVLTTRAFVASNYLDEERAYILPAGTFVYPAGMISHSSTIIVKPYEKWANVVTGLDSIPNKRFTYISPDYDVLYDSPFLAGNLEELPSFTVKNIPHRFIGYKLGDFDKISFMNDLKKIVETAVKTIGHIPYKHYTFIAIGPGAGGIEHLNNTTVSFSGAGLNNRDGRIRLYHFLAHEYFHHYNVKRIRPIELGPFDYDKGSRTKLLWISEGLSVYYEYMLVRRAGLSTDEELLNAFRSNIRNFEDKPGRLYQTLEQASWETWSDGPFGRTGDEVNKTISYYDKGPVVGMLLDFRIRHATQNKRSLDDVMRFLYTEYYQKRKRGFTDQEFRETCEKIAGTNLSEVFEYITTTKELDYNNYLNYAGLKIDLQSKELPGARLGINTRNRSDSIFVSAVEWESPAWQAGIRQGDFIEDTDEAPKGKLNEYLLTKKAGDMLKITFYRKGEKMKKEILLDKKIERSFKITAADNPNPLQKQILESWLRGS